MHSLEIDTNLTYYLGTDLSMESGICLNSAKNMQRRRQIRLSRKLDLLIKKTLIEKEVYLEIDSSLIPSQGD